MPAGSLETLTSSQLESFFYERHPAPSEVRDDPMFTCNIHFSLDSATFGSIELKCKGDFAERDVPTEDGLGVSLGGLASVDGVKPYSIEGVEGEGLVMHREDRSVFYWRYPDGCVLKSSLLVDEDVVVDPDARESVFFDIGKEIIPKVPVVASGTEQELTFYPTDATRPQGVDNATSITPWPSPSY